VRVCLCARPQVYEQEHQRMRQNWIDAKNRLESSDMMHLPSSDLDDPMRPEKVRACVRVSWFGLKWFGLLCEMA
jgi:hypothetical protein